MNSKTSWLVEQDHNSDNIYDHLLYSKNGNYAIGIADNGDPILFETSSSSIESLSNSRNMRGTGIYTRIENVPGNTGGNIIVDYDRPSNYRPVSAAIYTPENLNLFHIWVGEITMTTVRIMYHNLRTSAANITVQGIVLLSWDTTA